MQGEREESYSNVQSEWRKTREGREREKSSSLCTKLLPLYLRSSTTMLDNRGGSRV